MRVLFLFSSRLLDSRGTPSRSRNLARALLAQPENEVLVLSGDAPGSVRDAMGAQHESVSHPNLSEQLARATARFEPQIIYGQTSKAVPLLARLGAPRPLTVVDLHGDLAAERLEQYWRPLARRLSGFVRSRLEELRWFGGIDAFTTVSQTLADRVRRPQTPAEVVWGGVDPELFRAAAPAPSDAVTVAYAGNFLPYQGLDVLVDAMAQLDSSFRLLLVGDSTGGERLLDKARQLLADRLTVADPVPYTEIPARLATADILVVPRPDSRTAHYGFPSKLPEYLSLGRAVVVTDVGEQGRVVQHGENGLVVPPGSATALTAALASLADENLRRRLGDGGRKLAEGRLSWDRIGRQLQSFFGSLLEKRSTTAELAGHSAASGG